MNLRAAEEGRAQLTDEKVRTTKPSAERTRHPSYLTLPILVWYTEPFIKKIPKASFPFAFFIFPCSFLEERGSLAADVGPSCLTLAWVGGGG